MADQTIDYQALANQAEAEEQRRTNERAQQALRGVQAIPNIIPPGTRTLPADQPIDYKELSRRALEEHMNAGPFAYELPGGIPVFQAAPLPTEQPPQKPTYLEKAIINPAKDVASGYSSGVAGTAHNLANLADTIEAGISPQSPASSLMQVSAPGAYIGANIAGLLDTALGSISAMTGQDRQGLLGQFADWLRGQQGAYEKQAQELGGNRHDIASQLYRGAGQAVVALPQYAGATAVAGPYGGMALMGALETADQGPLAQLLAAGEGTLTGGFLHVLGPAGRHIRIPIVAATTYAQLRLAGVDPETAAAQAITMGGLSGMGPGGAGAREIGRTMKDTATAILPPYRSILDPVKQQAIDFLRIEGKVPMTAGQQTGNLYLRANEATTAHMPFGSETAQEFHRGTGEAIEKFAGTLAERVHPEPQTEYTAAKSISDTYNRKIAALSEQERGHYETAWQEAGNPAYTEKVQVGTKQEPILDAAGEPTGDTQEVPVIGKVNMPVDIRWLKAIAKDELPKYDNMALAQQAQSTAKSVYQNALKMPDHITAQQAEEMLKGLKEEAGYGGTVNPNLRDVAQGTAARVIPRLQGDIDAAVAKTGEGNMKALQDGRRTHAEKMALAEKSDKFRKEPVQMFNQLTQGKDTGVDFLNEVAQDAPESMPKLGRAWIDKVFKLATQEGGWERARGILKQYQNLGDRTKELMFPQRSMREALDRFFLGQKIIAEQINPSGTELTKTAKEATLNPFKWFQGIVGSKILYTPRGIQLLTGAVQHPPRNAAEAAILRRQALKIAGPPEEPPEGTPPAGGGNEPPGGGTPPPAAGGGGLGSTIKEGIRRVWEDEEGAIRVPRETAIKWAIDPRTGKVLLKRDTGFYDRHVDWFKSIGLPHTGDEFDRIPRGNVMVGPGPEGREITDFDAKGGGRSLGGSYEAPASSQYFGQIFDALKKGGYFGRQKAPAGGGAGQEPIRIGQPLHEELQNIADQAARRIKERGNLSGTQLSGGLPIDPRDVKDMVQWGAAKLGQGIVGGPLWRREMVAQFGQIPRKQLDQIYEQAKEHEITKNVKDWRPGMMLTDIHPLTSEIIPKRESQLTVPDVQRYLQNMVRERLGEIPDDAPDQVKLQRMLQQSRKEFKDQMKQPYSGIDWYGPDTRLGDRLLREKFPELKEKTYNTLQKAMSAAMSNNSNPLAEAYNGARIWDIFRKTGEFPLKQPNGKNWPAQGIKYQIEKLNKLIDELGPEEAAVFLHEDHPGSEIKYFVPNAKDIRLGDYYPGSRILGPKIGNYFANIMDLPQDGTAVDVWEMRRKGRIQGKLFDGRGRVIETPRTPAERNLIMDTHRRIAGENDVDPRDAQSVGWHYEQELYRRLGLPVKSFRRSLGIKKYLGELDR